MKKFIVILIVIGLVVGGISYYFIFGSYSEGHRSGRIIKVSKKGVLFKTYEGQLDVGGLIAGGGGDGAATTIWEFSIKEEAVVKDLEKAVDSNANVKLHYKEKFYQLFFLGDTKYFVDKVIMVNNNGNNKEDKFEITDEMLQ